MSNSIRTPKQGVTANSRRIAQAVDNEEWQKVRLSMKGISTADKITVLEKYFHTVPHGGKLYRGDAVLRHVQSDDCDECIRVDNYIKALCRGGQLWPGESLMTAVDNSWKLDIRK